MQLFEIKKNKYGTEEISEKWINMQKRPKYVGVMVLFYLVNPAESGEILK